MDVKKPAFRPAQVISEPDADAAIASGDPERIRLALIDGSRCLADSWSMRHAPAMALHANAEVRWAAVFALDQARATWVPGLRDDLELIFLLERLAAQDPDEYVRSMVATVFADVISMLLGSSRNSNALDPAAGQDGADADRGMRYEEGSQPKTA